MKNALFVCSEREDFHYKYLVTERERKIRIIQHHIPFLFIPNYYIDNTVRTYENIGNINSFLDYQEIVMYEIRKHAVCKVIIALPNEAIKQVLETFKQMVGIEFYVIPYHRLNDAKRDINLKIKDCIPVDISKPRLRMLQLNISDHCNLNCKGCANYSNLVDKPKYYDLESYTNDLMRVKQFFWGIEKIKIMGGEPLLNDNITSYLRVAHEIFPDALIEIGTNGLLINKEKKELYACMRNTHASFVISIYPNTRGIQKSIEVLLTDEKVPFQIFRFKGQFKKYLYEKPIWSAVEGYKHCPALECHCLEDGWLSVCGRPLYLNRLNKKFNLNIPSGQGKWNLYTTNLDPWKLDRLLRTPFETCQFCGPHELFDWEISNVDSVEKSDWIVEKVVECDRTSKGI